MGDREAAPVATEDQEQRAVIDWWALACKVYRIPPFALFAIPNGGWRHPATAARLKAQGVRPGVPDLFLMVPRGTFHGLYIEMKRLKGGFLSPAQLAFLTYASEAGYAANVATGALDAVDVINDYLSLKVLTPRNPQRSFSTLPSSLES